MSHIDRIPELLDAMVVSPSIAEACRRVVPPISERTHWRWLIQSRRGDPELQEIEWHGVTTSYEMHVGNTRVLAASAIEQAALDRALNGTWVPSYYQGAPVWEELDTDITDPEILYTLYGQRDRFKRDPVTGEKIQVRQWLKPSEQLAIKMLESWHKRYRPSSTVDVNVGGVLRLERPGEGRDMKVIDAKPILDDDNEAVAHTPQLALGRPATSSAELDEWNQNKEFAPAPVTFVDAKGNRTTLTASPDPLLADRPDIARLKQQAKELAERGPTNRFPVDARGARTIPAVRAFKPDDDSDQPDDVPLRKPRLPERVIDSAGDGRMRSGYGKPAGGGFKVS